jgi:hypothetical protein
MPFFYGSLPGPSRLPYASPDGRWICQFECSTNVEKLRAMETQMCQIQSYPDKHQIATYSIRV